MVFIWYLPQLDFCCIVRIIPLELHTSRIQGLLAAYARMDTQQSSKIGTFKIFDSIRNKNLEALPEEVVRQELINFMVKELTYPSELIIVEKGLKTLRPFFSSSARMLPKRRTDILVLTPPYYVFPCGEVRRLGSPKPLLLIECKARVINHQSKLQLLSYNYTIGAPCVALVSHNNQETGFINPETKSLDFYPGLPTYSYLVTYYIALCNKKVIR